MKKSKYSIPFLHGFIITIGLPFIIFILNQSAFEIIETHGIFFSTEISVSNQKFAVLSVLLIEVVEFISAFLIAYKYKYKIAIITFITISISFFWKILLFPLLNFIYLTINLIVNSKIDGRIIIGARSYLIEASKLGVIHNLFLPTLLGIILGSAIIYVKEKNSIFKKTK